MAAGTYTETVTINKSITLRGGFSTANWFTPDSALNVTTINANGSGRVIEAGPGAIEVTIEGFNITGGNISDDYGAGVLNRGSSQLILKNNAIYSNVINSNDVSGVGAGVANSGTSLTLFRNRIYANSNLNGGEPAYGGGIGVNGGDVFIESSEIFSNSATDAGGGIVILLGNLTLKSNLIYTNTASLGAGILVSNGNVVVENNTLFGNTSSSNGGGIYAFGGTGATVAITNSLIISNTAVSGGGIFSDTIGAGLTVASTDFYGNSPNDVSDVVDISLWGSGNRSSNPLFVNPTGPNPNLRLSNSSPAIDAGVALNTTTDFEGQGRPFGSNLDRGGDEYLDTSGTCFARVDNGPVFTTVQAAVNTASAGQVVKVAGRCLGVQVVNAVTQTVYLSQSITLRGGYTVTNWTTPQYGPSVLNAQGAGRVVYINGVSAINPVLENLYITGGSASNGAGVFLGNYTNATLNNNVITGNSASGQGGGVYNSGDGNARLQHNTIYNNSAGTNGGGIMADKVSGQTGQVTLSGNIVANNSGGGLYVATGGQAALSYNDFYSNTPNYGGDAVAGTTDVSVDPGFVDADAGVFTLLQTSALIDRGNPAAVVATDFQNDPRPLGSRSDIGADESRVYARLELAAQSPHIVSAITTTQNTPVTFTHTITNVGNTGSPTESVTVTIVNAQGWTVNLPSQNLSLTLGQPQVFTFVVTIPSGTNLSGIFNQTTVTATAASNASGVVVETDVIANPGLEFSPSYTTFGDPGEVITYTHTITNTGPSDTFNLTFSSTRGWGQAVSPITVTLGHNETAQIYARVRITDTAPAGLVNTMVVTAASQNYPSAVKTVTNTTTANATGGTRYVALSGTNTDNNCRVLLQPCQGIHYTVGQAANADKILVAQGTYQLTGTLLLQNVDVIGGYLPEFILPTGVDAAATVLQGTGTFTGPGVRVLASPLDRPKIQNLTIAGFSNPAASGGGLFIDQTSAPQLRNVVVQSTTAEFGGGIFIDRGAPTLEDVTVISATAVSHGGGIYVNSGRPILTRLSISGTQAAAYGGGIYLNTGVISLTTGAITGTTALSGGGIYVENGTLTVANSSVFSASATSGGGFYLKNGTMTGQKLALTQNQATQGGSGYQLAGTLTLSQSQVSRNTATLGGGLYSSSGFFNLWNSFVVSNTGTGNGGGLYKNGGDHSLINNTFYANQGSLGGAIFDNQSGSLVLSNTVVASNTATVDGGGVYRLSAGPSSVDYNLFWGNTAPGANPHHNLPSVGANSLMANPLFADVPAGDLRLTIDSPAIDSADPATFLKLDFEDDLRPSSQGYDMGADELAGCAARVTDSTGTPKFGGKRFGVIQEAIDAAANNDVIQIYGTCRGVSARLVQGVTLSQTVFISKSLVLKGGYNSDFTNYPDTDPSPPPTVLDALGKGRVAAFINNTALNVDVLHLTFTGGNAANQGGGPGNSDAGGAIYSVNNFLSLDNVVITGSQAMYGGGLYHRNDAGDTMLTMGNAGPVQISHNTASTSGGGLYLDGIDQPSLGQLIVTGNRGGNGGGLYLAGGTASLGNDSRFENNTATAHGGGVFVAGGANLVISQTTLFSNTAAANGGAGYNQGTITGSELVVNGNSASGGGGGFYNQAQLSISRSQMLTNTAVNGGGFRNEAGANLTLINTIVASNSATTNGGGLYNLSDDLVVRHDTFYGNSATGQGGGIYHNAASASPIINSTMLVNNSADVDNGGGGIYSANANPAYHYNNDYGNVGGGVNFTPVPADNISQAPTFLSTDPASSGFLRLVSNSAGEEKGDPASPVIDDIDGDPRPSNQNFDIGADEVGNCYVRINGLPPTYGKVQVAVNAAKAGDDIRIAGICPGVNQFADAGATISQTVFLTKSLTLSGGYTKADFVDADPLLNPTILDALSLGRVLYLTTRPKLP